MLERNEGNEIVAAGRVTANFFAVLGVPPLLGRLFQDDEDSPAAAHVLVLSYGGWQRFFGGDRQVIGRTLALSGNAYTVVGVLPPSFQFAPRGEAEIWVPLVPNEMQMSRRFMHWVNVIARLKPGITLGARISPISYWCVRLRGKENWQFARPWAPGVSVCCGNCSSRVWSWHS